MSEFIELKNKLAAIAPDNIFQLDPRTLRERLEALQRYAQLIPFAGEPAQDWGRFWFSGGHTPATLAEQATLPDQARALAPHQTFMLVLLRLLETPQALLNTLPYRHRERYYRGLLGLEPKPAVADQTVLSITLADDCDSLPLPAGCAFAAGQDSDGNALRYRLDSALLAGRQTLETLCWSRFDAASQQHQLCSALDTAAGRTLAADGLRLFQATPEHAELARELTDNDHPQQLFIGLSTQPGETLSLWWSLVAPVQHAFNWFCWSGDGQWLPLEPWLNDGTGGLFASGLWQATLPAEIPATRAEQPAGLPAAQLWLKAVPASTLPDEDCPQVMAIMANAMTATLDVTGSVAASHFNQPLAAGTLTQPDSPLEQIEAVSQPLASWGGLAAETQSQFFQRAAQRLSHRNRAVTWNDYRQLLMERYPQVMDVKSPATARLIQVPAPTEQQMVIVPHSRYRDNDDALRPALHPSRLQEMASTLAGLASPFIQLTLVNPSYITVTARFTVEFAPGVNPGYGYQQLNQHLEQQFMPWADDSSQNVRPGNRIDRFQVQALLQQSPLVSRVKSLTLQRAQPHAGTQERASVVAAEHEVLILHCNPTPSEGDHHD